MNKVINIRLGHFLLAADEDAYHLLSDYIRALKSRLAQDAAANEIISDIEERMGELLQARLNESKKPAVEFADAQLVIDQMGSPSDVGGEETSATSEPFDKGSGGPTQKRLFRNPDNKIIGGVCGGLGAYFNVDSVWIRLALAAFILFFGTGFFLYIILWIVIPEARTHAEKLMMRGETPNLKNIENRIKNEAEDLERRYRSGGFFSQLGGAIGTFFEYLFVFLRKVFTWIGNTLRIFLIVLGIILIAALFAGTTRIDVDPFYLKGAAGIDVVLAGFGQLWFVKTLLFLLIAVPVVLAGVGLAYRLGGQRTHETVRRSLALTWVAVIIALSVVVIRSVSNNHKQQTRTVQKSFQIAGDTLLLRGEGFNSDEDKPGFFIRNDLSIRVSEDSLFHIEQHTDARAESVSKARDEADAVTAQFQVAGDQLTLKEGRWLAAKEDQHPVNSRLVVYVPKGKFIKTSADFGDGFRNFSEVHEPNTLYKVSDLGIDPIDSKAIEIGRGRSFDRVNIRGNFKVELVQGTTCRVLAVSGPLARRQGWLKIEDDVLLIDAEDDWDQQWKRSIVRIEVPSLRSIKGSGKVEYYLSRISAEKISMDFSGDWTLTGVIKAQRVDLDASGMGKMDLEGHIDRMKIDLSGMGDVEARKAVIQEAEVELSGSNNVKLNVEKSITGSISGASRLVIYGKPDRRDIDVSGAAQIEEQP